MMHFKQAFRPLFAVAFGLALLGAALPAAAADSTQSVLSRGGMLYSVQTGTLDELLGNGGEEAALVLDMKQNGVTNRMLVPGTDGPEVESSPFVVADSRTASVYLVWESRKRYIYSRIYLASFTPLAGWSEAVEISGDLYSFKSTPRVAVTRDTYTVELPSGSVVNRHRTIFHVVWWEQGGTGERPIYSPLVLIDGAFQRPNPFFDLTVFDTSEPTGLLVPPGLSQAPVIFAGQDSRTAIIAFATQESGRLTTLEVGVVPQEVSEIADRAGAEILDVGFNPRPNLGNIALRAGAEILDVGIRWHQDFVRYLATSAQEYVLAYGDGLTADELADGLREELQDTGARLTIGQQQRYGLVTALLEIKQPTIADSGHGADLSSALVHLRVGSNRPAPELDQRIERYVVYPSTSGEHALIAWQVGLELRYVESEGDRWGDVRSLQLIDGLTVDAAHQLLAARARNR